MNITEGINYKFLEKSGRLLFYLGLFLLPSALSLSSLCLIISSFIGYFLTKGNIFKEKINLSFLIAGFMILISSIFNTLRIINLENLDFHILLDKNIGLFNWLPLIFGFYGFQPYLTNKLLREKSALYLLFGTVPVIFSVFGQAFFQWYGPLETLNGLVIWYQRPMNGITSVTGLFNNPNYLGSWLNIIWPFGLALFLKKDKFSNKRIIVFLFLISIVVSIVLCLSRAAWLNLILSVPLIFGRKSIIWIMPFLIIFSSIIFLIFTPIFGESVQLLLKEIIPVSIWSNFDQSTYTYLSRFEIWKNAIEIISNNPITGIGTDSFPKLIEAKTGYWRAHTHNLPIELMISYGIPASLFILIPFLIILKSSIKKVFMEKLINFKKNIFDKSWVTSLLLLAIGHLVDIQYFDGRISIVGWILLAGAKNIITEESLY